MPADGPALAEGSASPQRWPLTRQAEWSDERGQRWVRRGDRAQLLGLKAVRHLLRCPEVQVVLNNLAAGGVTKVPPQEREALLSRVDGVLRDATVSPMSDHTWFWAAEFRGEGRERLLMIDEF